MDFDGIAQKWANAGTFTAPAILSAILGYDTSELIELRKSVSRHANLQIAVDVIDGVSAFKLAKQRLDDARIAALSLAENAKRLASIHAESPGLARESVQRATSAQDAANVAFKRASSPREKIDAAVILELADVAANQAKAAADAADQLSAALAALITATDPPHLDGMPGS